MTVELARLLLSSGAVTRPQLQAALFATVHHGVPFPRALLAEGALDERTLERELEHCEIPLLRTVAPLTDAIARLPVGLCTRLLAVPVRADPFTSTIDVAAANPLDSQVQTEFSFHLRAPIRVIRAPLAALDEALESFEGQIEISSSQEGRSTLPFISPPQNRQTPALGSPALSVDLPDRERVSDVPIPLVKRSLAPHKESGVKAEVKAEAERPRRTSRRGPLGRTAEASVIDPSAAMPRPQTQRSVSSRPAPIRTRPQTRPDASGLVDPAPLLARLRVATSRDEVVDQIVQAMSTVTQRAGVLVLRKNCFVGWQCTAALADPKAFLGLKIPSDQPSALSAAAGKGWFLGHLAPVPPQDRLAEALGAPALEVSLVAVRVGDRTVMLILSTDLHDTMTATRLADLLAREAGEALARILAAEKRSR